jgi:3-oxoacyl-[acyl-carrier-protein] synthase III
VALLDDVIKYALTGVFELIEEGAIVPESVNWLACHYSSYIFRSKALEAAKRGGLSIPEERWFSNLEKVGNIGSASPYVMLEELLNNSLLKPGQKILCVVPESGRFTFAYVLLTAVGSDPPALNPAGNPLGESLVRQLASVWIDFESQLREIPILKRLHSGNFTLEDYKALLFDLRQQVIDGSRWISRAASNITGEYFPIRSAFIAHSADEHRDYEMLEKNYESVGGSPEIIRQGVKNIGSDALSGWILSRADRENPFDLIGTMFIIEGLGQKIARSWGTLIRDQLSLKNEQVSFFLYHSDSDVIHFKRLDLAIQSGILTEQRVGEIVKAAKVTARLYALQLEEIGNY